MFFSKVKQPYVVYLNKVGFIWSGDSLKIPIPVEYAKGVFADMEFQNVRNLDNQMLTMIEAQNLKPDQVIIILSNELFFSQQFPVGTEEQMNAYLAMVPFNDVVSKRFQNISGQFLVAVSNDLIEVLLESFTHHHFEVIAILPDFAFGESLKSAEQFTHEFAQNLMKTFITLQPYSFYEPPKPPETMTSIRDSEGKIFSPRLIGMIVLFLGLIAVLIGVLYMNGYIGRKTPPPVISVSPVREENVVIPTPFISEQPIASISAESSLATQSAQQTTEPIQTNIAIEIASTSENASQAGVIRTALTQSQFTQISSSVSTTAGQRTLILYKATVTPSTLQAIIGALTKQNIDASAQESPDLSDVDVSIIVGR